MQAKGWKMPIVAGQVTEACEVRAGVTFLAPVHWTLQVPDQQYSWDLSPPGSQGRLMVVLLQRKASWMAAFCCYLWTGEGWTLRNLQIFEAMAKWIILHKIPWLAMGDWNMEPWELCQHSLWGPLQAVVRHPEQPTCRTVKDSTLDYFLLDKRIQHLFSDALVDEDARTAPHCPVWIRMQSTLCQCQQRVLVRPERYGQARPQGPQPSPKPFAMQHMLDQQLTQQQLDEARRQLCTHLEDELAEVYQMDEQQRRAHTGRGADIRYRWQPLLPNFRGQVAPQGKQLAAWQWLSARLHSHWKRWYGYLCSALDSHTVPQQEHQLAKENITLQKAISHGGHWGEWQPYLVAYWTWVAWQPLAKEGLITMGYLCHLAKSVADNLKYKCIWQREVQLRERLGIGTPGALGLIHRLTRWRKAWAPAQAAVTKRPLQDPPPSWRLSRNCWTGRPAGKGQTKGGSLWARLHGLCSPGTRTLATSASRTLLQPAGPTSGTRAWASTAGTPKLGLCSALRLCSSSLTSSTRWRRLEHGLRRWPSPCTSRFRSRKEGRACWACYLASSGNGRPSAHPSWPPGTPSRTGHTTGQQKGALRSMRYGGMLAEEAQQDAQEYAHSGTALVDMAKCFAQISHHMLWMLGVCWGVDPN